MGAIYLWEEGTSFDHVPLEIRANEEAFNDMFYTCEKPVHLDLPAKPINKVERKAASDIEEKLFVKI